MVKPTYRGAGACGGEMYGRLETGEAFLVEDDRFRPYFFAPRGAEAALAAEPDVRFAPTELRDLAGRPLVRVETNVPAAVPRLRERLAAAGHKALEADVRFAYRYLIDHGIRATLGIHSRGVQLERPRALHEPEDGASRRCRAEHLSLDLEQRRTRAAFLGALAG